jgi:hypothetical protein
VKLARVLALLGLLLMTATISYGLIDGSFNAEGSRLLAMPWGRVALIDVYVGFAIFSGWIIYREKSALRSIIWIIAMIVLGNLTACLYLSIALWRTNGNWKCFWLGQRAEDPTKVDSGGLR